MENNNNNDNDNDNDNTNDKSIFYEGFKQKRTISTNKPTHICTWKHVSLLRRKTLKIYTHCIQVVEIIKQSAIRRDLSNANTEI